jgi:hypothetical protein
LLGALDTKSRVKSIHRIYSELIGALDTKISIHGRFLTVIEYIGASDSFTRTKSYFRTVTELLGGLDTKSRIKSIHRTVTELIGGLDKPKSWIHGKILTNILKREKVNETTITVPDWLSSNSDIDSSVWSKKKSRITLTTRVNDAVMYVLIMMKHSLIQIYDGYNTYTAFILNREGYWTTDPTYPWTVTIDFIVISSDET